MHYMLDTDICSYIIRNATKDIVSKYEEMLNADGVEVCISPITYSELLYGIKLKPSLKELVESFIQMEIIPWDKDAAYHYADIRAVLKNSGIVIGTHDMQIAAHARSIGAIVVTNNNRHFKEIPGIIVQNWA